LKARTDAKAKQPFKCSATQLLVTHTTTRYMFQTTDSSPKNTAKSASQTSIPPQENKRISKKTILIGLLIFLAFAWILAQSALPGIKHHLSFATPEDTEVSMSGKRTVGYFVRTHHHSREGQD
jgi:hypothetical protein